MATRRLRIDFPKSLSDHQKVLEKLGGGERLASAKITELLEQPKYKGVVKTALQKHAQGEELKQYQAELIKLQEHLPTVPFCGNLERAPVGADRIEIVGHVGWIRLSPGVGDIDVDRIPVPVELPVGGHGNLVPVGDIEVGTIEIHWPRIWVGRPMEPPGAVERSEPWRSCRVSRWR